MVVSKRLWRRYRHGFSSLLSRLFLCVVSLIPILSGCGHRNSTWTGRTTYVLDAKQQAVHAGDNSLIVFPLVNNSVFDTTPRFSSRGIAARLPKNWHNVILTYKETLDSAALGTFSKMEMEGFYRVLAGNDILALQTRNNRFWELMPASYLLIIRIVRGLHIKTYQRQQKKKAVLEAELWNTRTREVVWRCETQGADIHADRSEELFIQAGILSIVRLLQDNSPVSEQKNW